MKAIRSTQLRLQSLQPLNYGIMTGLLTFMLQSVLFTPFMVSPYIRESLGLLYYKQVADRFGMFFLHNLDLSKEKCLPEVLSVDDADVLKTLGVKLKKRKQRMPSPIGDEIDYPIGRHPTWKEVKCCLKDTPWNLMRRWSWSPRWDLIDREVASLFTLFTCHIWATLNDKWKAGDQAKLSPVTLQDALECWTIQAVHSAMLSVTFIASNAGLTGSIQGLRIMSFGQRRATYFPQSRANLNGIWFSLAREPGYISRYISMCETLDESGVDHLNDQLEKLLNDCQCLPTKTRTKDGRITSRAGIWEVEADHVLVLTNPLFYKIVGIGNGGHRRAKVRRAPTHTGKTKLQTVMLGQMGVSTQIAKRAIKISKKSRKAKNKRVPPKRAAKEATVYYSGSGEGEQDEQSKRLSLSESDEAMDLEEEEEDDENVVVDVDMEAGEEEDDDVDIDMATDI